MPVAYSQGFYDGFSLCILVFFMLIRKEKSTHSELHPAWITVNKATDTVGKSCDFMQLPLPWRKNVLYGISRSRGIRKQINNKLIHKVVME